MMYEVDLYWYRITVVEGSDKLGEGTYDGDTVTATHDFDCGRYEEPTGVRFAFVDTPELRDNSHSKFWKRLIGNPDLPDITADRVNHIADIAKDYVDVVLPDLSRFSVRTEEDESGKYGRLVGQVYAPITRLTDVTVEHVGLIAAEIPSWTDPRCFDDRVLVHGAEHFNVISDMLIRGLAVSTDW